MNMNLNLEDKKNSSVRSFTQLLTDGHVDAGVKRKLDDAVKVKNKQKNKKKYVQKEQPSTSGLNSRQASFVSVQDAALNKQDGLPMPSLPHPVKPIAVSNRIGLKTAVTTMFIIIVVVIGLSVVFVADSTIRIKIGREKYLLQIERESKRMQVVTADGRNVLLSGELGLDIPRWQLPSDCTRKSRDGQPPHICLDWKGHMKLLLKELPFEERRGEGGDVERSLDGSIQGSQCFSLEWRVSGPVNKVSATPHDCFDFGVDFWYGGGLYGKRQCLEVNRMNLELQPFVIHSADISENGANTFGPILDRHWITSQGISLSVDERSPLHASINRGATYRNPGTSHQEGQDWRGGDGKLCFHSSQFDSSYVVTDNDLKYKICISDDIKLAQKHVMTFKKNDTASHDLGKAKEWLRENKTSMFAGTLWSTGPKYGRRLTQQQLLEFQATVNSGFHGNESQLRPGALVIDGGWEIDEGNVDFAWDRFPDITNVTKMLTLDHGGAFPFLIVDLNPFVNIRSKNFARAVSDDLLVKDAGGVVSGLIKRYQIALKSDTNSLEDIHSGVIDFSNKEATRWYVKRIDSFSSNFPLTIRGFQFSAGEIDLLPYRPHFDTPMADPNHYTRLYGLVTGRLDTADPYGHRVRIIGSAYRLQASLPFVRLYDRPTGWKNLRTVLPCTLAVGLIGYPYVIPPSIGGVVFNRTKPSKELYARWLQLTTFQIIVHFSSPPQDYGQDILELAERMVKLHDDLVVPEVKRAAKHADLHLTPIIRPLWWHDPSDVETYKVVDQFLVGDDVLVAPVLHQGVYKRRVYLPEGTWNCSNTEIVKGPKFIDEFPAPLFQPAPHCIRIRN